MSTDCLQMVFSLVKLRDKTIWTPPPTPYLFCPVCSFLAIAQHYFWGWEGEVTAKRACQFSSLNLYSRWGPGSPSSLRVSGLNQLLNFFVDHLLQCNLFPVFRKSTKNSSIFSCTLSKCNQSGHAHSLLVHAIMPL